MDLIDVMGMFHSGTLFKLDLFDRRKGIADVIRVTADFCDIDLSGYNARYIAAQGINRVYILADKED